jgi:hypothetical protein
MASLEKYVEASGLEQRAALAWTEAVTKISEGHVPDEMYDEARDHFSEKELVDLTAAVIAINAWNRAAIAFGKLSVQPRSSYHPRRRFFPVLRDEFRVTARPEHSLRLR